ncbi:MAG: crossover junction endodeoxyribonuclease RuvC [Bryobacteraceae bacterium]|nr:crossover junction endodeoxyribonuclease RuvC [Bryobacteraceae bacterium]
MRILGIDCGAERTGYGVIESDGRAHRLVDWGVVRTRPADPLSTRLQAIAEALRAVIARNAPAAAAVEEVFYAANVKTALKLAHVRGVALLAVAEAGLPCAEYSALAIKTAVVGYGRAEKRQVQMMVASVLGLEAPLASEDASDALAVAICHATTAATRRRVQASRMEVLR